MITIRIVQRADGEESPIDGMYIRSFDPKVNEDGRGQGALVVTPFRESAVMFRTTDEAVDFWRQPSLSVPKRPDGKPNRPLTAYTVSFEGYAESDPPKDAG